MGSCFTGVCGHISRADYVVMGPEVNMAARLMGKAKTGSILASERVYNATSSHIGYDMTDPIELKGRDGTQRALRPFGKKAGAVRHKGNFGDDSEVFVGREEEMKKLRIGDPLDKSIDMGAIVDPKQLSSISKLIKRNSHEGNFFQPNNKIPSKGCYYPPTLITEMEPSAALMQEEIFGPVLVSTTFRTPNEAIALANNTKYGLAASIWTENINLALDLAPKIQCGVVWINSVNQFDAAAGFGGRRESGFGREGGSEGLLAYVKPKIKTSPLKPQRRFEKNKPKLITISN